MIHSQFNQERNLPSLERMRFSRDAAHVARINLEQLPDKVTDFATDAHSVLNSTMQRQMQLTRLIADNTDSVDWHTAASCSKWQTARCLLCKSP
jgi:hypothetical protein